MPARRDRTRGPICGAVEQPRASSVVELVERVARIRPSTPALELNGSSLTFGELWRRSLAVGDAMAEAGAERGAAVAVWGTRTPNTVVAALAAMTRGAFYVAIDPAYPQARVHSILACSDPVLLAYDGAAEKAAPPPSSVPRLDAAAVATTGEPSPAVLPTSSDLAYAMFTSGSTGAPKGVLVEHGSLVNYCAWCAETFRLAGGSVPLFGSLGFDHTITSLWAPLIAGARVVLAAGAWDRPTLFEREAPYSLVKTTPSHLRFFERMGRPAYSSATRVLMSGGEALDVTLVEKLLERLRGIRLVNHYGPTEATVGCCFHEFDCDRLPAAGTVPIGRPVWNTRLYVVDENLEPARPGDPGELVVAGAGVARGYAGDSGDPFVDESLLGGIAGRAYRTGDWVERLPDGSLVYLGRRDDQVKVNGYRLELGELRAHTLLIDDVADAVFDVAGQPELLEAFVVPGGGDVDAHSLAQRVRAALAETFPAPAVPRRVRIVSEIISNAHGKRDVHATRRLADGEYRLA